MTRALLLFDKHVKPSSCTALVNARNDVKNSQGHLSVHGPPYILLPKPGCRDLVGEHNKHDAIRNTVSIDGSQPL